MSVVKFGKNGPEGESHEKKRFRIRLEIWKSRRLSENLNCFFPPTTIAQHDRFGEIEIRNRPRSRPSAQNAANRPPITHSLQFHTLDKIIFQANFHSQVVLTLPKIIVKSVDFPEGVKIQNSSSTVPLADAHNARISPSANCTVRLFGCPLTLNNRSMIESTSSVFA